MKDDKGISRPTPSLGDRVGERRVEILSDGRGGEAGAGGGRREMTKIIELQRIQRLNDQIIKQGLLIDTLRDAAWPEVKFCKSNDNLCASMLQTRVITEEDYQCLLTIRQKLKGTTTRDAEEKKG